MVTKRSPLSLGWHALLCVALGQTGLVGCSPHAQQGPADAHEQRTNQLTAEDKIEIIELAARFDNALDKEDVDAFLATFTEDGTLEAFWGKSEGKEGLRKGFWGMLDTFARNKRHCLTNHVIEGSSEAATMVSYVTVFNRNDLLRGGSALVSDKLVKVGGVWRIKYRYIAVDPSFPGAPPPKQG